MVRFDQQAYNVVAEAATSAAAYLGNKLEGTSIAKYGGRLWNNITFKEGSTLKNFYDNKVKPTFDEKVKQNYETAKEYVNEKTNPTIERARNFGNEMDEKIGLSDTVDKGKEFFEKTKVEIKNRAQNEFEEFVDNHPEAKEKFNDLKGDFTSKVEDIKGNKKVDTTIKVVSTLVNALRHPIDYFKSLEEGRKADKSAQEKDSSAEGEVSHVAEQTQEPEPAVSSEKSQKPLAPARPLPPPPKASVAADSGTEVKSSSQETLQPPISDQLKASKPSAPNRALPTPPKRHGPPPPLPPRNRVQ